MYVALQHVANPHGVQVLVPPSYVTAQFHAYIRQVQYDALQPVANPHGVQEQPSYVTAQLRGLTSDKYVALQHVDNLHRV